MNEIPSPSPEDEKQKLLSQYGISPDAARAYLEHLGYTHDLWEEIMHENKTSHEVRGLISIAQGDTPQLLEDAYEAERRREEEYTKVSTAPEDAETLRRDTEILYEWYGAQQAQLREDDSK